MNRCCSPNIGRRDVDKSVTPPLHQTVTTLVVGTCTKLLQGLWAWRRMLVNPPCDAGCTHDACRRRGCKDSGDAERAANLESVCSSFAQMYRYRRLPARTFGCLEPADPFLPRPRAEMWRGHSRICPSIDGLAGGTSGDPDRFWFQIEPRPTGRSVPVHDDRHTPLPLSTNRARYN